MNFEIDRKAKIAEAEALLVQKLMEAMPSAEALVLWLDRPAIFIAAVTSWAWEVLRELEPMALEQVLRSLEKPSQNDTPSMLPNRRAIAVWIRSEREMEVDAEYVASQKSCEPEARAFLKSVSSVPSVVSGEEGAEV